MAIFTGAEGVARVLKQFGVEHLFCLPGGQDALLVSSSDLGIDVILARSEKSAALMAEGYARVSFKPGICSAGIPGVPLLVAGLHEAYYSSIPLIAITNDSDPKFAGKNPHHHSIQFSLFERITKCTFRVEEASTIPDLLRRAFWIATSGRPGPVALVIPDNILLCKAEMEIEVAQSCAFYPSTRIGPDVALIAQAAKVLSAASRPVIVAGGGVITSQAWSELFEVADWLGAPVATTLMGKGAIPDDHVASIGVTGYVLDGRGGRGRIANEIVKQADVVLLVGNKTDAPSTSMWRVPAPGTRLIHIDVDVNEIGRNYPAEIGIVGDAKLSLRALKEELVSTKDKPKALGNTEQGKEIHRLIRAWREEIGAVVSSNAVPIKPQRLMEDLKAFIDANTIVVADASTSTGWAWNYLDVVAPGRTFIAPRGFAAIGSGFPLALGAKVAAPDKRVFCIVGDGGFGYDVMELETAVRDGIGVVIIVLNNSCMAMQKDHGMMIMGRHAPVDLNPTNYADIAQAIGCFAVRVERPQEIRAALKSCIESKKPALIDVAVDTDERPTRA